MRGYQKNYFSLEERQAHETLKEMTTSRKDEATRRAEINAFVLKPVSTFLEERLEDYVTDIKFPLLKEVLISIVEQPETEKYDDFLDEFYRQIQRKVSFGAEGKGLVIAHPDTHRMLKAVVQAEALTGPTLKFSKQLLSILVKDLEGTLRSRAAFILVEYLQHDKTQRIAKKALDKRQVEAIRADMMKNKQPSKALEILLEKL